MVHFVGAGSGAADLITVRGAKLLGEADVVIYAGSLVNPALLDYTREGCEIHDSAKLTLEEVIALIEKAEAEGKTTVRLHTGDSSIYGAVREQFDELEKPRRSIAGAQLSIWLTFSCRVICATRSAARLRYSASLAGFLVLFIVLSPVLPCPLQNAEA